MNIRHIILALLFSLPQIANAQDSVAWAAIQQSNWPGLRQTCLDHPQSLSSSTLDLGRALLLSAYNRYKEAIPALQRVISKQQHKQTANTLLYIGYTQYECWNRQGAFQKAYQVLRQHLQHYGSKADSSLVAEYSRMAEAMKPLPGYESLILSTTTGTVHETPLTIPFYLDSIITPRHKSVQIQLSGILKQQSVHFVFDTGAGVNVISRALAERLHLPLSTSPLLVEGTDTASGHVAWVDRLQLGNMVWQHVPFVVLDMSTSNDTLSNYLSRIEAIVGLPLLLNMRQVTIDMEHRQLIFEPLVGRNSNKNSTEQYLRDANMSYDAATQALSVEFFHDTIRLQGQPDTGAATSMLGREFLSAHPGIVSQASQIATTSYGGVGGIKTGLQYTFAPFQVAIGKTSTLMPQMAAYEGLAHNAKLGMDFFGRFHRICFDFEHMQLSLY